MSDEAQRWRDAVRKYAEWLIYERNEMLLKQTNNPPEQSNAWAMRKEQTGYAKERLKQILTSHGLTLDAPACEHEWRIGPYSGKDVYCIKCKIKCSHEFETVRLKTHFEDTYEDVCHVCGAKR